jgi:hypothetical protein
MKSAAEEGEPMAKVVIGDDPYKRMLAAAAVHRGKVLAHPQFDSTSCGFVELRSFDRQWRTGLVSSLAQRLADR